MTSNTQKKEKKQHKKPTYEELEKALKASEALNQMLLDMNPFPISINLLEDGRYMKTNKRHSEITGFTEEELIGKTPLQLKMYVNPSDRDKIIHLLKKKGRLDQLETGFKTQKGRFIHTLLSARLLNYKGHRCILSQTTYSSDLSKAQEALLKSESRFANILNNISESYYEVDLKGNLTFFNKATIRLFGYPEKELLGLGYQTYTTPEDAKKIYKAFNSVYRETAPVKYAGYRIIRKDGSIRHVEVSISLLRDPDGKAIGFYGVNRDRTEQKKVEEVLRQREEKYRTILEEMEEGYYEIDLKGNFTFFNNATLKLHGKSADKLMGANNREYLSPEQAKKAYKLYIDIYNTGKPVRIFDYEIIREDGSICLTEISGYPLRDDKGHTVGFWGITRDRTKQKKAELALKKSEEQYRLVVENANEGIYITQKGIIKFHNSKTRKITGYPQKELEDISLSDLVHAKDKEQFHAFSNQVSGNDENPNTFSFRILNKSQKIIWVELSMIPITWEGQPATLNFLRDITLQKKMETKLIQAEKMEAIGTLAGGIAHDFNNILTSMIGFTELVIEDLEPESIMEENLREVLSGGERAKELVSQILTFARQSEENLEPVMVCNVVKEALRLIRSSIPSNIEIQSNISSKASIIGNQTQVHQIIMNLCSNAAHAMENSGGILRVDLSDLDVCSTQGAETLNLTPGNYLKLSVSDTGSGIPEEILNSIFEPYFTTKGMGEGTGMGLSVVQGIVEKYGGEIFVKRQIGRGTTFSVYLPASAPKEKDATKTLKKISTGNERILVVDDEPAILKMESQMLSQLGYKVTSQGSSVEALNLFKSKPQEFDLVITDMTMPQLTGDLLAAEMIKIRPDIPVVLCTGYSKHINEKSALKIGIKALVNKPVAKNHLADTLRKVLDEHF